MSNSIVLNFKILEEQDITVEEFLKLYGQHTNKVFYLVEEGIDLEKLEKNLFIKCIDGEMFLREKAVQLINFLTIESTGSFNNEKKKVVSKRVILSVVDDKVDEFRNKWRGLKPGSMGDLRACKEKLHRWMKENPKYSFDDILKAADIYLASEGANLRYLQRADYFIYKQDSHKEEVSRLSSFIDEINSGVGENWTSNLS